MSNPSVTAGPDTAAPDPALLASLVPADAEAAPEAPAEATFADLGLPREVQAALDDMGYFRPTPVQAAVYAPVVAGKDLLVQSRTGTGKTTAFGLPIISSVDATDKVPQAIVLTPTRELALQVCRELASLGKHKGLSIVPIYGGAPIGKQIDQLRAGVHIVVGTPGRVLDLHLGRAKADLRIQGHDLLGVAGRPLIDPGTADQEPRGAEVQIDASPEVADAQVVVADEAQLREEGPRALGDVEGHPGGALSAGGGAGFHLHRVEAALLVALSHGLGGRL